MVTIVEQRKKGQHIPSRPNRRSVNRLAIATKGYQIACESNKKNGAAAFTQPGSQKRW